MEHRRTNLLEPGGTALRGRVVEPLSCISHLFYRGEIQISMGETKRHWRRDAEEARISEPRAKTGCSQSKKRYLDEPDS